MKITLLHYSAPPVVGGVESVIEHHAGLMTEGGHEVSIVAARGAQFTPRIEFISAPLIGSRHPDVLAVKQELDRGVVSQQFHDLTKAIEVQLAPLLKGSEVLIAHNVCSLNKNLPLTAALFNLSKQDNFPPLILWHHDLAWAAPRYQKELHDGFPWNLLKTAWPKAIQVTVSEMRQQEFADLAKIERSNIQVIPNGVDIGRFLKLEDQTLGYIHKLDLLQGKPLLLLPVRITPRKNIEFALQVLAELQKDFASAQIVVTGPLGPHNPSNLQYFERLQALRKTLGLQHAVHFLAEWTDEFIPDAVISDFYKLADALLFPSFEEGFGIPILEAGLAGIPVFCSNIPSLQKIGGESAIYFSPDENPQVAAKLISEHFKNNKVLGLRSAVRDRFTWERIYATKIAPLLTH
jgi:glycosyltransferase involved in cell wall biosynthesis